MHLDFKNNISVSAPRIHLNPLKSRILDEKIDSLLQADLIEEVSPIPGKIISTCNAFVVAQNSQTKREEQLRKDDDVGIDIDSSKYRLVIDGRILNEQILHNNNFNIYVPSIHEIFAKMSKYKSLNENSTLILRKIRNKHTNALCMF